MQNKDHMLFKLISRIKEERDSLHLNEFARKRILNNIAMSQRSDYSFIKVLQSKALLASAFVSLALLILVFLPLIDTVTHHFFDKGTTGVEIAEKTSLIYNESSDIDAKRSQNLNFNARKVNSDVVLEWKDVGKEAYKISRSTSPKDFSNAYTVMVAGNRWSDPIANGAQIIFYKIE